MHSLLDALKDEATSASFQDQTSMENIKEWRCSIVFISLKMKVEVKWYFDSGNSKHMIGNKGFLTNL